MKCRTNKVEPRLSLSGIFSILHMEMINDKCGASHRLFNQRAGRDYGQMGDLGDLPVKSSPRLRAKRRFLGFARKTQASVTGKTSIFGICP